MWQHKAKVYTDGSSFMGPILVSISLDEKSCQGIRFFSAHE